MKEPTWVDEKEASAINEMALSQFGGLGGGARDANLFRAAIARPVNKWHYDDPAPDLFKLAAAYCYGIAKGRAFHDGNKRTAYVVAVTFLAINGVTFESEQTQIVKTMVAVADGSMTEQKLAKWFRKLSSK